jgi:tRNA (uracil-5-)-methyltransferase
MNTTSLTESQVIEEKQKLIAYWNRLNDQGQINATTLMVQIWNGDSNGITDKGETQVLIGDGYVYEEILGCR